MNFLAIDFIASPGYSVRECLSHHRKDEVIWAHLIAALAKDKIFSSFFDYGPCITSHDGRRWPRTTSEFRHELVILQDLKLQNVGAVEEMRNLASRFAPRQVLVLQDLPYARAISSAVVLRFEGLTTT